MLRNPVGRRCGSVVVGLVVAASACGSNGGGVPEEAARVASDQPTMLFTQGAESAVFDAEASTLTMVGVDERTVWFTDRPAHSAGSEATQEFIESTLATANADGSGAPNATLTWRVGEEDFASAVELTGGRYEPATHTAVYAVHLIEDANASTDGERELVAPPTEAVSPVWLFIDNIFSSERCTLIVHSSLTDTLVVYNDDDGILADSDNGNRNIATGGRWEYSYRENSGCSGRLCVARQQDAARPRCESNQQPDPKHLYVAYIYRDPDTGANHASVNCYGPITCSSRRNSNNSTLETEMWICEDGATTCGAGTMERPGPSEL